MAEKPAYNRNRAQPDNDFVGLATPVLEVIMKVKAGLIIPSTSLRREIAELLKQMEHRGETLRCNPRAVQAVKFALTAFVDETVLTADFPLRDAWERHPLQLEYFGEHLAGVTFFNRLEEMLKDPESDPGVVEVYYVCLLLGYEGKHKKYYLEQLRAVIEAVAEYLRRANRLRPVALSPHWKVTDQPVLVRDTGLAQWVKVAGFSLAGLAVLIYVVLRIFLNSEVSSATLQLLR